MGFLWGILSSVAAAVLLALTSRIPLMGRRVPFRIVMKDTRRLAEVINADNSCRPEVILGINRSGAIIAAVLCGLIGNIAISAPCVVALDLERRDGKRHTRIGPHAPDLSNVTRILLVSCTNDTGAGLEAVLDWLVTESKSGFEVYTAALYSNPKSIIKPRYVGREAGDGVFNQMDRYLTRMPWMVTGWRHDLANERLRMK